MGLQPGHPAADGDFDAVWVELTAAEAAAGTVRVVTVAPEHRPVTVHVPAGIGDQMAFRVPGAGNPPSAGAAPRDLVVRVRVAGAPPYGGYQPVAATGGAAGRRPLWIGLAAAALSVVLLAGCCAGSWLMFGRDDDGAARPSAGVAGTTPAPTGSPSAPPAAVTAAQYQQLLAGVDRTLGIRFAGVRVARSPKSIGTAADGLGSAVREQAAKLAAVTPPSTAAGAHRALLAALEELALAVDETASAADGHRVCAGPAAAALLSRSPSVAQVRRAAGSLATADPARPYRVGSFLPKVTKDTNRRLRNGSYLVSRRGGSGQLKINNGGRTDTVVSLVRAGAKKPVTRVYVRGKGEHTVRGVRDGTYQIYLASGADWDSRTRRFTRNCGFSKFDDTMKFTTTSVQYTIWSITVTPVVGGNARTTDVDPDAFPGG